MTSRGCVSEVPSMILARSSAIPMWLLPTGSATNSCPFITGCRKESSIGRIPELFLGSFGPASHASPGSLWILGPKERTQGFSRTYPGRAPQSSPRLRAGGVPPPSARALSVLPEGERNKILWITSNLMGRFARSYRCPGKRAGAEDKKGRDQTFPFSSFFLSAKRRGGNRTMVS